MLEPDLFNGLDPAAPLSDAQVAEAVAAHHAAQQRMVRVRSLIGLTGCLVGGAVVLMLTPGIKLSAALDQDLSHLDLVQSLALCALPLLALGAAWAVYALVSSLLSGVDSQSVRPPIVLERLPEQALAELYEVASQHPSLQRQVGVWLQSGHPLRWGQRNKLAEMAEQLRIEKNRNQLRQTEAELRAAAAQ